MKSWMAVCLLLCALGIPGAETGPNLVKNPSFRELDDKGMPRFWGTQLRKGPGNASPPCVFRIVEDGNDDRFAASIDVPEVNRSKALAAFVQNIKVKPNTRYYFTVMMKVTRAGAWAAATVELRDAQRKQVGYVPVGAVPGAEGTGYRQLECAFTTTARQEWVTITLRLQNLGAGTVLFDDAELVELIK